MKRAGLFMFSLFCVCFLLPMSAIGVYTVATRSSGIYFKSMSANVMPTPQSPGFYNLNGVLQACSGFDSGICFPAASPFPTPAPRSSDGGLTVGAGAALNAGTCSTGNLGPTCYNLADTILALKQAGILVQ